MNSHQIRLKKAFDKYTNAPTFKSGDWVRPWQDFYYNEDEVLFKSEIALVVDQLPGTTFVLIEEDNGRTVCLPIPSWLLELMP